MSKYKFGIGETVVIHSLLHQTHLNGAVAEVLRLPQEYKCNSTGKPMTGYYLKTDDTLEWIIIEACLERKLPQRGDMDAKVAWGIGPWKPSAEGIRIAEEMIKSGPWRLS